MQPFPFFDSASRRFCPPSAPLWTTQGVLPLARSPCGRVWSGKRSYRSSCGSCGRSAMLPDQCHRAMRFHIPHIFASYIARCAKCALQASDPGSAADDLERQLRLLRAKRFLKTLAIVQDLADTLLAVNDVRGGSCLHYHASRAGMTAGPYDGAGSGLSTSSTAQVAKADCQTRRCLPRRGLCQRPSQLTRTGPECMSGCLLMRGSL